MNINIPMEKFHKDFNEQYEYIYDRKDNVEGYNEAVCAFDEFVKTHGEFVGEYAKYRHDFISSDREAAAFMFAMQKYLPES